jgi:hypothetical protein
MADGSATVDTRYPNTPEYNNEKTCNEVGNLLMEQEQMKIGTNAGTVYFICKAISSEEVRKATGKAGSNS